MKIKSARSDEVRTAVAWHGSDRAYLLTLTIRHGLGDDLKRTRSGVSLAWRKVQGSASWKRLSQRVGLRGIIRAMEVTYGDHGFHPHLHIILLMDRADEDALEAIRASISTRWQLAVERTLGRDSTPDDRVGCDLRPTSAADYIAKLGLELTADASKVGRLSNRTPLQVASDWARDRNTRDFLIWRAYCVGIKGARMLTWSRGLRAAAGLATDRPDEELVEDSEQEPEAELVAEIEGRCWDAVRNVPGASLRLLEAAERGGQPAVTALLAELGHACAISTLLAVSSYG